MNRMVRTCFVPMACAMVLGCGGADEPKLKAVEPPDSPVKQGEVPNDAKYKGSSGAMKKNPAADS
jgi:hypothetical protein